MMYLYRGDEKPTVATVQVLLNRNIHEGEQIRIDGSFGRRTQELVRSYQAENGLTVDGKVGPNTWRALTYNEDLGIIDAVDVVDEDLLETEVADLERLGGDPIVNYGMSNGVLHLINQILGRAQSGKIALLRLHGHGAPGIMGVSDGHGEDIETRSSLNEDAILYARPQLARLQTIFCPFASVEIHGCQVGRGRDGRQFLSSLATLLQVPITGAIHNQYAGGRQTFRYEGPKRTVFPTGHSAQSWYARYPSQANLCVSR